MGDLNFNLEDIIECLADNENLSMEGILKLIASELAYYPKAREEYISRGHPRFYVVTNGKKKHYRIRKRKNNRINKKTLKELKKLIKDYVQKQKLQWGEVLYSAYGYICIHRPDIMTNNFFYGE